MSAESNSRPSAWQTRLNKSLIVLAYSKQAAASQVTQSYSIDLRSRHNKSWGQLVTTERGDARRNHFINKIKEN